MSEVWQKLLAHRIDPAPPIDGLQALGLTVEPFHSSDAELTGRLRTATSTHGLCLADRACLALAARLGRPAVTADRAWIGVDVDVSIQQIR